MNTVLNKPEQRALRSEHAARYKPRAALPLHRAVVVVEDIRLRQLTAKALEQLKRPDAIPSRILMTALSEAKALGRS